MNKEVSGIQIIEPKKTITIANLREKSILLSLSKASDVLTLLGQSSSERIQIIDQNVHIIREQKNNNTIQIFDLPKGRYFAITSKDDYYQFIKI